MRILLDNGHGTNTLGKRSPDGSLREFAWNREIAKRIEADLISRGYFVQRIVPEETDVLISERVRRVNAICDTWGAKDCVLISVHINAAGSDGQWHNASGWSGWIGKNASPNSKRLAQILYDEAALRGLQGNRYVPICKYWEANFPIVSKTKCPAVLTENLFQDNQKEVAYLTSEKGKQTIVDLHVQGLIKYINSL